MLELLPQRLSLQEYFELKATFLEPLVFPLHCLHLHPKQLT